MLETHWRGRREVREDTWVGSPRKDGVGATRENVGAAV